MKLALIGPGRWGTIVAKKVINELVHVFISNADKKLNKTFDNITKSTLEQQHNIDFDACIITTPIETQFEIAALMLKAGKHVFLEKPGTNNANDLQELIRLASDNNVVLHVNFQHDYDTRNHIIAKKILEFNPAFILVDHEWHKQSNKTASLIDNLLCHEISRLHMIANLCEESKKYDMQMLDENIFAFKTDNRTYMLEFDIARTDVMQNKKTCYNFTSNHFDMSQSEQDILQFSLDDFAKKCASSKTCEKSYTHYKEVRSSLDIIKRELK